MSRSLAVMLLASLLPLGFTDLVRSQDTAQAILDKAVRFHGGKDKLATTLTGKLSAKALYIDPEGVKSEVTIEEQFELPKRYKRVIEGEDGGTPFQMAYAITGDKGWIQRDNGKPQPYKASGKIAIDGHWQTVLYVLTLCSGKDYEISVLGESKVEGQAVLGVKLTHDKVSVDMFFDKKTGCFVKSRRRKPDLLSGKEVDSEIYYTDFKEADGVQFPMKVTTWVNGKKTTSLTLKKINFVDKLDDSVFAEPKP